MSRSAVRPPESLRVGLPGGVLVTHADAAWPESRRDGRRLIAEEDAMLDVPAPRDRSPRGRAVQPTVDALLPVISKSSRIRALVMAAVGADQGPCPRIDGLTPIYRHHETLRHI
jgi:hypothetical protein